MLRAPARLLPAFALAILLVAAGCEAEDPLQEILRRQAGGDYAGTLEPLRDLVAERPDDAEVLFLYGRTLVVLGEPSLAEWSLREAMNDPEWLVPAGQQLAFVALTSLNYPEAVEITTRILEEYPDSVEALLLRASAHAHSKLDPEAALADVERIQEIDPENLDAMKPKILALLTLEDEEAADAALEELGRRIEESDVAGDVPGWHCATTAIFTFERGDAARAEELWEECLEKYPAHGNVVTNAVKFFDGQHRFDRSLEILRRAQAESPESRDYRVILAGRLATMGEIDEAEALLREATETENLPRAASAWIDLAKHQKSQEQFADAAVSVERAVAIARELEKPSAQLLFEYADALVLAGEFDRALEITEQIELPAYREMILARVAQDRGDPATALEHYDEAFRLWPDNVWARYMAALAAEDLGDFDVAMDLYRYAIRISAADTDARQRVARILLAEGKAADALPLLRFNAVEVPLDLEGELMSAEAWAMNGEIGKLGRALEMFRIGNPENLGRAFARAARGFARRFGPTAAEARLREWAENGLVDFEDPLFRETLRALVEIAPGAGRADAAFATVNEALAADDGDAAIHAIHARALATRGAPASEIRAAYDRALALDPDHAPALVGLGELELAEAPEAALAHFERAAAQAEDSGDAVLGAARALVALSRAAEAEERLTALLDDDPVNGEAAAALADLRIARGETDDRTLDWARRAARFGGGAEAQDRLSRLYTVRGETELASTAAKAAEALRKPADG